MHSSALDAAQAYQTNGINVIPIRTDGSKAPALLSWKEYQTRLLTEAEAQDWWGGTDHGLAIICGKISGWLEVLDFDELGLYDQWADRVKRVMPEILASICRVRTPSGGDHVIYRCPEGITGNQRLAMAESSSVRIETRGEGGYIVAPPSPGSCHPSGNRWEILSGDPTNPPTITKAQRAVLHEIAASFDERRPEQKPANRVSPEQRSRNHDERPGDAFNTRGPTWAAILTPHGWVEGRTRGNRTEWRRPGKDRGISATTGGDQDIFWCFSTSTDFEPEHAYSKFACWAMLNHNGDWGAAARELKKMGYGAEVREAETTILDQPPEAAYDPEGCARYTDLDNARLFAERYASNIVYSKLGGGWHQWDGKRWARCECHEEIDLGCQFVEKRLRDAKLALRQAQNEGSEPDDLKYLEAFVRAAKASQSRGRIESMLSLGRGDPRISVSHREFDSDPWLVNLQNGTYDLNADKLRPHRQSDRITKICGVSYDPGAQCPRWDRFIGETFPDADVGAFVRRYFGSMLAGVIREHILAIFHGVGSNGKSVLVNVMTAIFGDYAVSVDPDTIAPSKNNDAHPTGKADLLGKRMGVTHETDAKCRLAGAKIKQLTGGDIVKARWMGRDFFEFEPTHKLILLTNHKPWVNDAGRGIWRRLALVPFDNVVPEDQADRNLTGKLLFERNGVFNWILEGFRAWQAGGLQVPDVVRAATADYQSDEDTLGEFFEDRLETGQGYATLFADLYDEYCDWAEQSKARPASRKGFARMLDDRGIGNGPRRNKQRTRAGVRIQGAPNIKLV